MCPAIRLRLAFIEPLEMKSPPPVVAVLLEIVQPVIVVNWPAKELMVAIPPPSSDALPLKMQLVIAIGEFEPSAMPPPRPLW